MTTTTITVRAQAFRGSGVEEISASVDADGTVRVYDSIAGYYTTCHSLGRSALARIRRLAGAARAARRQSICARHVR